MQAAGTVGNQGTLGDEVVQSGLWGTFSYSLGQFHFETDGFRDNNDLTTNIYDVFLQSSPWPNISLQAEYRHRDTTHGDLALNWDLDVIDEAFKRKLRIDSVRLGAHYQLAPDADFVTSVIFQDERKESKTAKPSLPVRDI